MERQGNFSQSVDGTEKPIVIKDPTPGLPFPGNIIPPGSIYGPGQAIINFLPQPNTTAGGNVYNYTSQVPSSYPRQETIVRGDWQINSNTRLSLSWINNQDDQQFAYGTTTASWNWPLTTTDRKNGPGNISTLSVGGGQRSEEHTSELQSHSDLVCRLLLEKKKHTRTLRQWDALSCSPRPRRTK